MDKTINENDFYVEDQLVNGIRQFKLQMRYVLVDYNWDCYINMFVIFGYHYEETLTSVLLEDDFINWILETIESLLKKRQIGWPLKHLMRFMTFLTDINRQICHTIIINSKFQSCLEFLIENADVLPSTLESDVFYMINNITCQYDPQVMDIVSVKDFILRRIYDKEKLAAILTLLRLSSTEEINLFSDEICSVLDEFLSILMESSKSNNFHVNSWSFKESIKNIVPFSKCGRARKELAHNSSVQQLFVAILTDDRYIKFIDIGNDMLPELFDRDQMIEIRNHVENIRRRNIG